MLQEILSRYMIGSQAAIEPFGTGLIHHTWLVKDGDEDYILQKINQNVFKNPVDIAVNVELVEKYLKQHHPGYLFVAPLKTKNNHTLVEYRNDFYRLFSFVQDSHTYDIVRTQDQAFEAAKQFARFTHSLSGFPLETLKITLPQFHDLTLRYSQFEQACQHGNSERIKGSRDEIAFLRSNLEILKTFEKIKSCLQFKQRVTHHDTKISNVLFDKKDRGICVIDLDTVMPGYFISDTGDMLRTYLSPVSEEEKDFSKIEIREEYFKAVFNGYMSEMSAELSKDEIGHFVYSGAFMIYMQAIRFLTDHLNNDSYYGAAYEGHNYVRAGNQIRLLQCLQEKESHLNEIVDSFVFLKSLN